MRNGLRSKTYKDLLGNAQARSELQRRHRVKTMLEEAAVHTFSLGKCPSAYDEQVYTPFSMKMERKIIGI